MAKCRYYLSMLSIISLLLLAPSVASAQQATPVGSTPSGVVEVVASGLTNPRGFTWGPDGTLYVALAGSGGQQPATEIAPTTGILGPFLGGLTGALVKIDANGCPVLVAGGLPSTADAVGEVLGAEDVAFLGGQLYVSADGGGPVHGNEGNPSGVYRVNADGSTEVVADLSTWLRDNPVANEPPDYDPDADGYRMVADEAAGVLWVLEPNAGGLLSVTPDGQVTRVADLSAGHPVPASMVLDPDGGVYIGMLTAVPFTDGSAKVVHVAADGTVSDAWTGLTTVTGLAVGTDGTLFAAELSTGNLDQPPFLVPGSGKVVRQTGPSTNEEIATGLNLPIALGFGPDGQLYVSLPAIGANQGQGMIARLGAGAATPAAGSAPACSPVPETIAPAGSPVASPVA